MKNIVFFFLLLPVIVFGQPEILVHNSRLYVDDYAGVFTDQQETELDGLIRKFFDTAQISIVTIKSFGGIEPGDYATRLGRSWGVGGKSNNGLLIVIGIDDRKMFAATGSGIEGDLPDVTVVSLQHQYAVPRFKEGRYFEGTRDLLNSYINRLSPSAKALRATEEAVRKQRSQEVWQNTKQALLTILFILGIAALIGLPFYLKWRKKWLERKRLEEEREEKKMQSFREYQSAPVYLGSMGGGYSGSSESKSSSDDNSYSSKSSSSDDSYSSGSSSSGSDFGGGSFSGGGGGSSW